MKTSGVEMDTISSQVVEHSKNTEVQSQEERPQLPVPPGARGQFLYPLWSLASPSVKWGQCSHISQDRIRVKRNKTLKYLTWWLHIKHLINDSNAEKKRISNPLGSYLSRRDKNRGGGRMSGRDEEKDTQKRYKPAASSLALPAMKKDVWQALPRGI